MIKRNPALHKTGYRLPQPAIGPRQLRKDVGPGAAMVIVSTRPAVPMPVTPVVLLMRAVPAPTASVVYQYDERSKKVVPYSLVATLLKVLLRLVPTVVMMVTAATAIRAAISPYSTAVTPVSSPISFVKNARIGFFLWFDRASVQCKIKPSVKLPLRPVMGVNANRLGAWRCGPAGLRGRDLGPLGVRPAVASLQRQS